jgi:8-oxo-dGTP diphosphatase
MSETDRIFPHIATINDADLPGPRGSDGASLDRPAMHELEGWDVRFASRCVVTQGDRVALQDLATEEAYKVPGGGVQYNENVEDAIHRELEEEVGIADCALQALGIIIEYRREWRMVQISYCFRAALDAEATIGEATEAGSSLVWAENATDALRIVRGVKTNTYDKRFMTTRDARLLEFYQATMV